MFKNYNEPKRKVEDRKLQKKEICYPVEEYNETVKKKMEEMRSMYGGRRNNRRN